MNLWKSLVLTALLGSWGLAQEFSVSSALSQTNVLGLETPTERPAWDRLLFGPLPEGYQGYALSTRLLVWSVPWTLVGSIGGLATTDPFARSFWLTNSAWAAVNSGIALAGLLGPEPDENQLRTLLYINAALDVLYIAGGTWLVFRDDPQAKGAGWAVILQGAFLLVFDLIHGLGLE